MNGNAFSRAAFHGAVIVAYCYALVATAYLPHMPYKQIHERWGGFKKYLTYWNLMAHVLYFVLAFCIDFMRTSSSNYRRYAKLRDTLYAGIVFPYGVFVAAVFWTMFTIERELLLPKEWDGLFPDWLLHLTHTLILPVVLIEMYILRNRYPNRKDGLTVAAAFWISYTVWLLYQALVMNIWAYPFLKLLSWGQRFLFLGVTCVLVLLLYLIGEKINTFWGRGNVSKTK